MSKEKLARRDLPHWYMPYAAHFVTFRLAGILPQQVLDDLRAQKERLLRGTRLEHPAVSHRELVHKQLFAAYDKYLDCTTEIHWLDDPRVAALVRRSLYFGHSRTYELGAINANPVKAGQAMRPRDYFWCSAHDRFLHDGDESGWLDLGTSETLVLRAIGP